MIADIAAKHWRFSGIIGSTNMIGFTVLEWCGIAAIVAVSLAGGFYLFQRLLGFSPRLGTPHRREPTPAGKPPSGKEKILIADDDPLVTDMMSRLLGRLGYQVVSVDSGEKAVEYMQKNGADLILLDAIMGPGMDGLEACRRIRQFRPFQRVIMISGHASPERVAAIRSQGVEHYLIKPVPLLTLAQSIRAELDRP